MTPGRGSPAAARRVWPPACDLPLELGAAVAGGLMAGGDGQITVTGKRRRGEISCALIKPAQ